jgi:transcriptional regulator with XRE-family HTH domain
MNLKIGSKIKTLRLAGGLTQEKLAENLGVSTQAVSKWESENGYPDIELLPALANFFGISSDELVGIDITRNKAMINGYIKRYHELSGDPAAQLCLMREAAAKFPYSHVILQHLMYALVSCIRPNGAFDTSGGSFVFEIEALQALKEKYSNGIDTLRSTLEDDENRFLLNEALSIAERILDDCTDDAIRHSAIQVLCCYYPVIGRVEEAQALVKSMPSLFMCRELLQEEVVLGDERIRQIQRNICLLTDSLCSEICAVADPDLQLLNVMSLDEKIHLFELANRFYQLIFENGDFNVYNARLAFNYRIMASLSLYSRPAEDTLSYVEKAAAHAVAADALPESTAFSSPAVNHLTPGDLSLGEDAERTQYLFRQRTASNRIVFQVEEAESNQSGILLKKLEQPRWDPVRDTDRFKAVLARLSQK